MEQVEEMAEDMLTVYFLRPVPGADIVKVLERPGIEPGTIRYLDWTLYH